MGDAHRRVRGVDALPTGARSAHDLDLQVLVEDVDLDVLRFGQHGDRDGGSVDAARAFGHRNALHPVHPALELEAAERSIAFDEPDDLLESAEAGGVRAHNVDLPAPALRVARVHPEEVGGEQARLVTAGAGADLEQDAALVARVPRHEQPREVRLERLQPLAQRAELGPAELAHLGVAVLGELLGLGGVLVQAPPIAEARDYLFDPRAFLRQLGELAGILRRPLLREQCLELVVALGEGFEPVDHNSAVGRENSPRSYAGTE